MKNPLLSLAALPLLLVPGVASGQIYTVALNQQQSSTSYSIQVAAPFATTPPLAEGAAIPTTSYLIGGAAATPPTTPATRTSPRPGFLSPNFPGNHPVAITSGSISANVTSGASPLHPNGSFQLVVNTAASTSTISGGVLDLLGGATVPFTVNVSVGFQSFHTRSPNSLFIIPGITVPLNQNAVVTGMLATQGVAASGTLTPTATPGVYAFSVPLTLTLAITATLNGNIIPIPNQDVDVVIAGTIDTREATTPLASNVHIADNQTAPDPVALDPLGFQEPIYGGHLLAYIVLASQTVNVTADLDIHGTATRTGHPADFNQDGSVDPDDLSDFITCFFLDVQLPGTCPQADFNADGFRDPDDLSDYITAFFTA